MTILVFGASGQVGAALGRDPRVRALGRAEADLLDPESCAAAISGGGIRAVINAAAYTAVDKAEGEPEVARAVNADAPGAMARAAAEAGVPFVHVSTDYVFDGSGERPWREDDAPGPVNVYGATKLAGEKAVEAAGGAWAVLRTSWVFSATGSNFVKTMLRLGSERDALRIVEDQIGGPTPADAIASAALRVAEALAADPSKRGVYHFAGAPDVSWAGFAEEIFARSEIACRVEGIPSKDYPTPAQRPFNSRLDCSRIAETFGIARPDWRKALDGVIADIRKSTP